MIVKIKQSSYLYGNVCLPASKSYSIRAFIIASCGGKSLIINPSNCDDVKVSMKTAESLGAKIIKIDKNIWQVDATNNQCKVSKINVKESGTVLRFLLPLVSLLNKKITINGEGSLKKRPNRFLIETLQNMGMKIKGKGKNHFIPIDIMGGKLKGGSINIDGSLSSQFISALLITCPQLKEDTILHIRGRTLVSSDYIIMTKQILKKSNIKIVQKHIRKYFIKGNQYFKGINKFSVPSDYGLTAYLMSAGALVKSDLVLNGYLPNNMMQADGEILNVLSKMGVSYKKTFKSIKMKGPFVLKSINISLKNAPDLVPIITILSLFAKGKTRLFNIKHVRVKESDRISDLRKELLKIGAKIVEKSNELIIYPQKDYKKNCLLDPHNDHRLAMAFCILGLRIGVRVKDTKCIAKSYPNFLVDLKSILRKNR